MEAKEIKALLQTNLDGCQVEVSGEGSHFDIVVVGDVFEGLNAVKKQQLIYAIINEHIASGAIHAVNIKALTPAQAAPGQ
jgi:acid stress-induced BolA-like protein IbaG/YrbA